jgi:hypothetical protein
VLRQDSFQPAKPFNIGAVLQVTYPRCAAHQAFSAPHAALGDSRWLIRWVAVRSHDFGLNLGSCFRDQDLVAMLCQTGMLTKSRRQICHRSYWTAVAVLFHGVHLCRSESI